MRVDKRCMAAECGESEGMRMDARKMFADTEEKSANDVVGVAHWKAIASGIYSLVCLCIPLCVSTHTPLTTLFVTYLVG